MEETIKFILGVIFFFVLFRIVRIVKVRTNHD